MPAARIFRHLCLGLVSFLSYGQSSCLPGSLGFYSRATHTHFNQQCLGISTYALPTYLAVGRPSRSRSTGRTEVGVVQPRPSKTTRGERAVQNFCLIILRRGTRELTLYRLGSATLNVQRACITVVQMTTMYRRGIDALASCTMNPPIFPENPWYEMGDKHL